MKMVRRAIAGAGVVLIVLLALGAAAPYLVDGSSVRNQFFTKMSGWIDGGLRVRGPVYLTSLFELKIEAHDVEISAPRKFDNVAALHAERIAGRLNLRELLSGRVTFDKIWVNGLHVRLNGHPRAIEPADAWRSLVLNDPPVLEDIIRTSADAPFFALKFTDATIGVGGDRTPLSADLGPVDGTVERAPGDRSLSFSARALWRGAPIRVELERSPFRPEGPTSTADLHVSVESGSLGRFSAEGRIIEANGTRFLGRFAISEGHAPRLASLFGLPVDDALAPERLSARGSVVATLRDIALSDLEIGIGGAQASGVVRVDLGARAKVSGTLALGTLDLSGTAFGEPAAGLSPREKAQDARTRVGPALASRIAAALMHLDADLRLSADRLTLGGVTAGPAAAFLSLDHGLATLDIAEVMAFDGALSGQFAARPDGFGLRVSGKGRARSIELAHLFASGGATAPATGNADVSFEVEASGTTLAAMAKRVRLTGRAIAVEGGELALDIADIASRVGAPPSLAGEPPTEKRLPGRRGRYDSMSVAFAMSENRLDLTFLQILSDQWVTRGNGRLDLSDHSLDCRLETARMSGPIEARAAPFGDFSLTPRPEESIEFRVIGPMQAPSVIFRAPASALSDARG